MLESPFNVSHVATARKFNRMLHKTLLNKNGHFIMDINDKMFDESLFTAGSLNHFWQVKFRHEIDNLIEQFEYRRISLKPKSEQLEEQSVDSTEKPDDKD